MVTKLRIKFEGSVKTCQLISDTNAKKIEESLGGEVVKASDQSKKRGPSELVEVQAKKKQKLDRASSSKCLTLLRFLSENKRGGYVFGQPVDPVKLKIPDYFDVIKKPMDLGTIKSKLVRNVYGSADEFAADVRLTFDNAMLYNPPDNAVHKLAKEFKETFEVRWESLKKKKTSELSGSKVQDDFRRQPIEVDCSRQSTPDTSTSSGRSSVELKKPVKRPMKGQSQKDTPGDTSLATKLRIKRIEQGLGVCSTVKIPSKGSAPTAACKCGSCDKVTCICLKSCNSSGSDVSSLTDCQIMNTPVAQASESDPQSNGSVNSRNEKNGCVSSQLDNPSTTSVDNDLKTTIPPMPPLPPEMALRAAMLKSQFAETILRAKHRKVLDQSNKADLIRIQIEKEQMERTQREERARIEAQMREAKFAARMRAEAEFKQQVKQQRERERLEREQLEKTCGLEEYHFETLHKDLAYLCGSPKVTRSLLVELGLVLKNHYCPKMELELSGDVIVEDAEEGEIL